MRHQMNFRAAIAPLTVAILLAPSLAQSQQPRYSSDWSNPDAPPRHLPTPERSGEIDSLLKELRALTREAERHRAADPTFLSDLRDLARRYSWPWHNLVVADDFRDGDYTRNPKWRVISGSFQVRNGRLITTADGIDRRRSTQPRRQKSDDIAREILGGLLGDLSRDQNNQPVHSRPSRARIFLSQRIPNRFAIRLKIRSRASEAGRFEFGVGQGKRAVGYYLQYNASASPSLALIQKNARGRAVIDAFPGQFSLEDGRPHTLQVTRDRRGFITVSVDGDNKIRVRDRSYRDPFSSFVMTNRGGSYAIHSVAIYGAPAAKPRQHR